MRNSGRTPKWCPACRVEVERERDRLRHARNPEHKREQARRWYEANRERALARDKAKYDADPEPKRSASRERSRSAPELSRERSRRWRKANPEKRHAATVRRRARKKGAAAEVYDRSLIFERDEWTCQLCGLQVDPTASGADEHGPTIDHIVPLALGGADAPDNVQLAHRACNTRKGTKVA